MNDIFAVVLGGLRRNAAKDTRLSFLYDGVAQHGYSRPLNHLGWHCIFFFMLVDSHLERRAAVHSTLGLPR